MRESFFRGYLKMFGFVRFVGMDKSAVVGNWVGFSAVGC